MNENDEANRIAETTFTPKVKNIFRLLDDNGYRDTYTFIHNFDTLTISITHPGDMGEYVFILDLSSPLTDVDHYDAMRLRMGDA